MGCVEICVNVIVVDLGNQIKEELTLVIFGCCYLRME